MASRALGPPRRQQPHRSVSTGTRRVAVSCRQAAVRDTQSCAGSALASALGGAAPPGEPAA